MPQINHDSRGTVAPTELEGRRVCSTMNLTVRSQASPTPAFPAPVGGRGVAAELMRSALELAAANGWTVKPVCAYAVAYLQSIPRRLLTSS